MNNIKELTLSDLLALYNNYILVDKCGLQVGSYWSVLSQRQADIVRIEIDNRLENLDI